MRCPWKTYKKHTYELNESTSIHTWSEPVFQRLLDSGFALSVLSPRLNNGSPKITENIAPSMRETVRIKHAFRQCHAPDQPIRCTQGSRRITYTSGPSGHYGLMLSLQDLKSTNIFTFPVYVFHIHYPWKFTASRINSGSETGEAAIKSS